jgi:hypothetical protein
VEFVSESIDVFPFMEPPRGVRRREDLLLADPLPGPLKLWRDAPPIEAQHITQEFVSQKFAPPLGVFECDRVRLDWQTMTNERQPFFHRNPDVDELSFQIWGERTLITELGSVEHVRGDFSRIPLGVAHDNYGREESHLIFYAFAPVEEQLPARIVSNPELPPFPGWEAGTINELITGNMGKLGGELAISPTDERYLLELAERDTQRIQVLTPHVDAPGTTWLYKSADLWIGYCVIEGSTGMEYRRHLNCDEVQYQVDGNRYLVTQQGMLELQPGDFVRIPQAIAFADITAGTSHHVTLMSATPLLAVLDPVKTGEKVSTVQLDELRRGLKPPGNRRDDGAQTAAAPTDRWAY